MLLNGLVDQLQKLRTVGLVLLGVQQENHILLKDDAQIGLEQGDHKPADEVAGHVLVVPVDGGTGDHQQGHLLGQRDVKPLALRLSVLLAELVAQHDAHEGAFVAGDGHIIIAVVFHEQADNAPQLLDHIQVGGYIGAHKAVGTEHPKELLPHIDGGADLLHSVGQGHTHQTVALPHRVQQGVIRQIGQKLRRAERLHHVRTHRIGHYHLAGARVGEQAGDGVVERKGKAGTFGGRSEQIGHIVAGQRQREQFFHVQVPSFLFPPRPSPPGILESSLF